MLEGATLPRFGSVGRRVLVGAALHADGHEQADGLLALLHEAALLAPGVEAGDGRQRQALVEQLQRGQQLIADAVVVKRPVGLIHHAGLGQRDVQDRPHVAQLVGLNVPRAPPLFPICLLASLGAEEQRNGGVVAGVVGLCVHAGGLVWWLEICPSVSPRRMNSGSQAGHKGTTTSRSSKTQQSEAQRPGEDVGASLHPWGLTGSRYASERGGTTGRSATPSERTHRPAHHPTNDTREASQLSDLSPHRGALQSAQRRPEAERRALGLQYGVKASAEGVSRAWATRVQREGDQARVVPA